MTARTWTAGNVEDMAVAAALLELRQPANYPCSLDELWAANAHAARWQILDCLRAGHDYGIEVMAR